MIRPDFRLAGILGAGSGRVGLGPGGSAGGFAGCVPPVTAIFGNFPVNSIGYYPPSILAEATGVLGFAQVFQYRTGKIYNANSRLLYESFAML
jgi:hypothetical protein